MRFNLKASFFAAFAIIPGVIVLLGYFIQSPGLVELRDVLVGWAAILIAVLLLVGVLNLARTHWHKVTTQQSGAIYSLVLLTSLIFTMVALVIERLGLFGASGWSLWLLENITIPVESSLLAILAIVLIYTAARLFSRSITTFSIVFIVTTLFMLFSTATLPGFEIPGLRVARDWIVQVLASAGARGILLGVALGTVATGLRILMGADRPYGG